MSILCARKFSEMSDKRILQLLQSFLSIPLNLLFSAIFSFHHARRSQQVTFPTTQSPCCSGLMTIKAHFHMTNKYIYPSCDCNQEVDYH